MSILKTYNFSKMLKTYNIKNRCNEKCYMASYAQVIILIKYKNKKFTGKLIDLSKLKIRHLIEQIISIFIKERCLFVACLLVMAREIYHINFMIIKDILI